MEPKAGNKTSEFWLSIGFMGLCVANGTEHVNIPWDQIPFVAGVVGLFSGGRSYIKGRTIKTLVAAAVEDAKKPG